MADSGTATESLTIEDFHGFHFGASAPLGGVVDRGGYGGNYRSRGFQIDSEGKLVRSHGYSSIAQVFEDTGSKAISQIHGLHYWKGPSGGSTLILAGTFGILRSRQSSVTPGTTPFMLRFDALAQAGPSWTAFPSADAGTNVGPAYQFGHFAEFSDRLYYANGLDWPVRIAGFHDLFARSAALAPQYYAAGVFHPSIDNGTDVTIGATIYKGKRSEGSGVNVTSQGVYLAAPFSRRLGEGPARVIGSPNPATETDYGNYAEIKVDWSQFEDYITAIRFYRTPRVSTTPQFVVELKRPTPYFVDTVADGELGYALPYDTGLPSHFRLIVSFQGRMFGVGGFGRLNRVTCTKEGYPDVWPLTFEIPVAQNLGTRTIKQAVVINGNLYFLMDQGILRLAGTSPENYSLIVENDFVGINAPRTLFPWQDGYVWQSDDGLYFFNGSTLRKVLGAGVGYSPLGAVSWSRACGAVAHDYYYLSYRDDSGVKWKDPENEAVAGQENNRTLVVNMTNGRVGVIDDWFFNLSTPYGGTESIVLGHES